MTRLPAIAAADEQGRRPARAAQTRRLSGWRNLFEEIVEGLLRARRARRRGGRLRLALHCRPRLEERALVAGVLGRDARRHRFLTLEGRARVEVGALRAGVEIRLASRTGAHGTPGGRHRQLIPAAAALHDLAEAGHVER